MVLLMNQAGDWRVHEHRGRCHYHGDWSLMPVAADVARRVPRWCNQGNAHQLMIVGLFRALILKNYRPISNRTFISKVI